MSRVERRGDDAVFRALADETRRRLLDDLRDGPRSTGALVGRHPEMTRFGVMDHLRVLVDAGLVIAERRGRERHNHLNPVPIRRIQDRWLNPLAASVADELVAIEAAVRKDR
jgi:DNA-binding transcriptional ArsR family regulator